MEGAGGGGSELRSEICLSSSPAPNCSASAKACGQKAKCDHQVEAEAHTA